MEAPPAAELQAKRLSELKTARIVVFVDAASLPQHAGRRLVLPEQLRPRNSDGSGADAVIMVVVGRVSGPQLCQLLSLVELQDVDKLQRSGVLLLYPPVAAASSERAPHYAFPHDGTGFEPVPSEHRASISGSATLLPFIAGRVHEVVSPAARVVVVSGDAAMDCVVAQLQAFGRAANRVAPTVTVTDLAVSPVHDTGGDRPCVPRGATYVADSSAAAAPPAAEHPPLCVSCGARMAGAGGSPHTTSDRDSRSSGSHDSSVGSSSGGAYASARHAVGGGLDSPSDAEAGASASPRERHDGFQSLESGEATPPVPRTAGRVDADEAGGRPGATPSRNSARVRKSELDLTAHCHHSDAAAFVGTLLMLVDEAAMCVAIDGVSYALPDASAPVNFSSISASAVCVATRDGVAVATPPVQLLSSLVRRLLRASSDPGAFVWLCMAELARQRALAFQNVAACDYILLAEPATCNGVVTSRGAAHALTSGSPASAVAPQASMDTVHAAVSKALLVGLRAHAAKLRPEHEVLVLELWIQHCMWICHCACGSDLLPSLVERLKRVQGQVDCGGSDELADNVVELCVHSTQCRGFPCGGDVLALFAWLGTRLQEGEVPLPHAG